MPATPARSRVQLVLGADDLAAAAQIAGEAARRSGRPPSRTDAVRWALRELRARLDLERQARRGAVPAQPGPMTPPP